MTNAERKAEYERKFAELSAQLEQPERRRATEAATCRNIDRAVRIHHRILLRSREAARHRVVL